MKAFQIILILSISLIWSCGGDDPLPVPAEGDLTDIAYDPQEYVFDLPDHFPGMVIPEDNPMTVAGVELGRHLFYDPILSGDSTQSCGSCHLPSGNFTDNLAVSKGIQGIAGSRSAMTLLNIGFVNSGLFWDGRIETLEEQALVPIEDPIELHDTWPNVESKLQRHKDYPAMFRQAFGISAKSEISRDHVTMALAQFERSLVSSGESKYDRVIAGRDVFSDDELRGHNIFFDIDPDVTKHAECGHCHNAPLFTTNEYFNNGIQNVPDLNSFGDMGRGAITGITFENGAFRVPTLRNIFHSAPYMHDGRFETFDEVLEHYISGGHVVDNIGAVMRPLDISEDDRRALIAFIRTLDDPDFMTDPAYQSPFE